MADRHDDRRTAPEPVTSGGGAHDVTGAEAAEHVPHRAPAHSVRPHAYTGDVHATEHVEDEDAPLGPIDWTAWGASVLGIAIAGVVVALLYVAIT